MWLDKEIFKCVVANAPLVSIDLLVKNKEGQILLGKRLNEPAKGFFFVPGGRIRKNERIKEAFNRIIKAELGLSYPFEKTRFLGIYEHFYDSSVFGIEVSTHYIVLAYLLTLDLDIKDLPKDQHERFVFLSPEEILPRADVHEYVKCYFSVNESDVDQRSDFISL